MSTPILAISNHLRDGTLTSSTSATDYPVESCIDGFTTTQWKPTGTATEWIKVDMTTATAADYFAVFAHDLHTQGASLKCYYSTDDISYTQVGATATPTTSRVIFQAFTSVSARYWKLEVTGATAAVSIGVAAIGARIDVPEGLRPGFVPPHLGYDDKIYNHTSNSGAFTGRSVEIHARSTKIGFDLLTPAWVRSTLEGFIEDARTWPFFFAWDNDGHSDEAAYCWTNGKLPRPEYDKPTFMRFSMDVQALTE